MLRFKQKIVNINDLPEITFLIENGWEIKEKDKESFILVRELL